MTLDGSPISIMDCVKGAPRWHYLWVVLPNQEVIVHIPQGPGGLINEGIHLWAGYFWYSYAPDHI